MAFAMSLSRIVLPVLGGATISARWPLPIGENMSTTRVERLLLRPPVRLNFSSGKSGVRCSNGTRSRMNSGWRPLIVKARSIGKYFSPSRGGLIVHSTTSPAFSPLAFICAWVT